ncbi:hypothetical protein ACGFZQ_10195 [Streptomyces sp. NPDC048254]|uniref:hypothetical protein n=1 Tax=Streptomyces sp. NPDC048254 TaxID=3365525 RepID=UPI00371B5574
MAAVREAAWTLGATNPVAHHVTNVVVTAWADDSCGSVSYDDTAVRIADGWRISHRRVSPRRTPLGGMTQPG